jgi:hypothetical protein
MEGSYWFRRLVEDSKKISCYIRFKRIKYGFYRIYYKQAYIGECSKDMFQEGYDIEEKNWNLEDKTWALQNHDLIEQTARLKNFKEGYWQTLDMLRTRIYMFRKDREFYKQSLQAYSQVRIK